VVNGGGKLAGGWSALGNNLWAVAVEYHTRLRWAGNIRAEQEAAAAAARLKPKAKHRKERKQKKKKHRNRNKFSLPQFKGTYLEYLQSPHWKRFRKMALADRHYACERCKAQGGLEIHHKHYDHLGHESLRDVLVLCRACHEDEHGIVPVEPHLYAIMAER